MTECEDKPELLIIYVAADAPGNKGGIYVLSLDPGAEKLNIVARNEEIPGPHYVRLGPAFRNLYAVSDSATPGGPGETCSGMVSGFAVEDKGRRLVYVDSQPTGGTTPCYVSVDPARRSLFVANFRGPEDLGSLARLPLTTDGRLKSAGSVRKRPGRSVHPTRQRCSHMHCAVPTADGRFLFAADLGTDAVVRFRLSSTEGQLEESSERTLEVAAGSGPRHIVFHPSQRFMFAVNEIANSVMMFSYDPAAGVPQLLQEVSTLPEGYSGSSACADIRVHPTGRSLYASNRGHDSIATFRVDEHAGLLELQQIHPCGGGTPRAFAISPDGAFMFVANQQSDAVVVFRIDARTGLIHPTGMETSVPVPVSLAVLPGGIADTGH